MNHYKYIKVFGERNSGTNFLHDLCVLNFPKVEVLSHGSNQRPEERLLSFPDYLKRFALERLIDSERLSEFPQNFGWKHASISPDYLRGSPRFPETLFVTVLRHPYRFIKSLFRRPYNIISTDQQDVSKFIRSAIILNHRDNLDDVFAESPVQIWNIKTRSYLETTDCLSNMRTGRYEDIVLNIEQFLDWLAMAGLERTDKIAIPMESTKNDDKNFYDYRNETLNYDPDSDFCVDDLKFRRSKIDKKLMRQLGYDPIDLSRSPNWGGVGFFAPQIGVC